MIMEKENEHERLNERLWDAKSDTWYNKRSGYFQTLQKGLVSLLDLREEQRLLDLGCGTGWAVRYAASLVNDRGEFDGIDISSKMIEKAISNSSDYRNVHFYKTSADKLPFENNFFDFIICSASFHHYFDPNKVLLEVYRVLKPKGRIYILDPTSDGLFAKMADKLVRRFEPGHVKFYSTQEYKTLFSNAGLDYVAHMVLRRMIVLSLKVLIGEKPSS
jgi:ubiquinone/menaquinone biosynthesis C-methylase UbiE